MAIKKSDLYASIWASCDQLRGGMDASQYKDYVLFMLFIKYISVALSDMDVELSALERDKTRALKQAMMRELLTGRTRLA